MNREKAIEKIKALLVNHKEIHIQWRDFLLAHPDQEEKFSKNTGESKHHEACIRDYDEALQALAELEQQPGAGEFTENIKQRLARMEKADMDGDKKWMWDTLSKLCERLRN